MSIDTTSVSNPAIREESIDSVKLGRRDQQGSEAGSKDGHFSGFWEKALTGAQRLFGLETQPERAAARDLEPADSEADEDAKVEERQALAKTFNTVPGFSSPGFRRLALPLNAFPENDGRQSRISDPVSRAESDGGGLDSVRKTEPSDRAEQPRAIESEDEAPKEPMRAERAEKSAESVGREGKTSPESSDQDKNSDSLSADNERLTLNSKQLGINSATHGEAMTFPSKGSQSMNTVTTGQPSDEGSTALMADRRGQSPLPNERVGTTMAGVQARDIAKADIEPLENSDTSKLNKPPAAKPAKTIETETSGREGSLGIDPAKARKAISTALQNAGGKEATLTQTAQKAASPETTGPLLEGEKSGANGDGRSSEAPAAKQVSKVNPFATQRTDSSRMNAAAVISDAASAENQVAKKPDGLPANHEANRASAAADKARPAAVPSGPMNAPGGLKSASPSTGVASVDSMMRLDSGQSQFVRGSSESGQSGSGDSQSNRPKNRVDASRATGVAEMKTELGSSSRSGSSKGVASGYATKSASETKEVYQALVKSVDRLIANKGSEVSVRLNFEQGGTLHLRVSVDAGRVSSTMQTDLAGLENLIKSNWQELASEFNQRGLKLNAPQFAGGDTLASRENGSFGSEYREGQLGEKNSGGSNDLEKRAASGNRPAQSGPTAESESDGETGGDSPASDPADDGQELKTYA